jgi:hypothetical protein
MSQCWSEGRAGAGIPVAAFAGVGMFASLPLHSVALALLSVVVLLLAITVESGFEMNGNLARSWWGWGRYRFGRWRKKPADMPWRMRRTRESLMNRRGAAHGVGIDAWDLGWGSDSDWCSVHEFTDPTLAKEVQDAL